MPGLTGLLTVFQRNTKKKTKKNPQCHSQIKVYKTPQHPKSAYDHFKILTTLEEVI